MSQKRILVIDDEFPVRYLLEHRLRKSDYDVHTAKDGPSGLEAARIFQPDLIVLDVMMPGMDGYQVCQKLRSDPEMSATPIVFLTACVTGKQKMQAFKVGGSDYLAKPFELEELLAHIEGNLRSRDQPASAPADGRSGRVISLYSPKGGVGTTTLAIQLSESVVVHKDQPVVLVDLDLPLGGVAPMLNMFSGHRHILDVLRLPEEAFEQDIVRQYAHRHHKNLFVIPAPGDLIKIGGVPAAKRLRLALNSIVDAGYMAIVDLGSSLNALTLEGMRQSDIVYVVTSGQRVANQLHEAFLSSAEELGLEPRRLLAVVNELHGPSEGTEMSRLPVVRIPHAKEASRTKIWLRDQGMQKLVAVSV